MAKQTKNSFQTQIDLIVYKNNTEPGWRSKHELSIHNWWFPDSIDNLRLGQRRELLYPEVPSRIPGAKMQKHAGRIIYTFW